MPEPRRVRPFLVPALAAAGVLALALASPPEEGAGPLAAGDAALARCARTAESSPEEAAALAAAAEEAFTAALETAPLAAHLGLASTLLECRIASAPMMEQAALAVRIETHLQAALELDPDHLRGHLLYAELLFHLPPFLGRGDDAVRLYERLIALSDAAGEPVAREVFLRLGDLHLRAGREEEAAAAWRRGLARHPDDAELAGRLAGGGGGEASGAAPEPPAASAGGRRDLLDLVERHRRAARVPGLAVGVARGGETLLLAGFGLADVENEVAMSPDHVFRVGSIAKQLLAVAALRLAEAGRLDLAAPVARWLPPELAPLLDGVTLERLLSHTAGLPRDPAPAADWLAPSLLLPRVGAPGERQAYSNLGAMVAGRVLESAAGLPFGDLLARWAIEPAGLAATALCDDAAIVPRRARGYAWRGERLRNAAPPRGPLHLYAGGVCSTARDLLRWQQALHEGGLLSPDAYRRLTTPPAVADAAGNDYALGLRVERRRGRTVLRHSGGTAGFLAELAWHPAERLSVVVLANADSADPRRLAEALAAAALGDEAAPPPAG